MIIHSLLLHRQKERRAVMSSVRVPSLKYLCVCLARLLSCWPTAGVCDYITLEEGRKRKEREKRKRNGGERERDEEDETILKKEEKGATVQAEGFNSCSPTDTLGTPATLVRLFTCLGCQQPQQRGEPRSTDRNNDIPHITISLQTPYTASKKLKYDCMYSTVLVVKYVRGVGASPAPYWVCLLKDCACMKGIHR